MCMSVCSFPCFSRHFKSVTVNLDIVGTMVTSVLRISQLDLFAQPGAVEESEDFSVTKKRKRK